jgi:hypothetical protein
MKRLIVVFAVVAVVLAGGPAGAQGGPRILEPASQSGVTGGEEVTVQGDGCPPGSTVEATFNTDPVATATADADGAWTVQFAVPLLDIDESAEEASEASIGISCDGGSTSIVVVYQDPAEDQPDGLPATAPSLPLVVSVLVAGLLLLGGVILVRLSRG